MPRNKPTAAQIDAELIPEENLEPMGDTDAEAAEEDNGVVDAVIIDEDEPEAEVGAMLAIPWDTRKDELHAEKLIQKSLTWQAQAQLLLAERNILALAEHIDAGAWLPGPTKLHRLVPIEAAPDIIARHGLDAMLAGRFDTVIWPDEAPTRTIEEARAQFGIPPVDEGRMPAGYAVRADVAAEVLTSTHEWPLLSSLIAEDGATTDPDVWAAR